MEGPHAESWELPFGGQEAQYCGRLDTGAGVMGRFAEGMQGPGMTDKNPIS